MRALICTAYVALALGAAGCKNGEAADGEGEKRADGPPKRPFTELITGKKVTLLGPFAKLRFGMTGQQAREAAPELFTNSPGMASEEFEGVRFSTYSPKDRGTLETMHVQLPKDGAREALIAAWGAPVDAEEHGRAMAFWFNPEDGIRACLKEGFGDGMDLEFRGYIPAAKLIGDRKGAFGFETKPILGATAFDLEDNYPAAYASNDVKQPEEEREDDEKPARRDAPALAKARASVWLDLPPTEWSSSFTRVHVDFDASGKVNRFRFGVDYERHPAAREEALKLLEGKLGKPIVGRALGRKVLVYSVSPRIFSDDDNIIHAIEVTVEAPTR